jgi:hypothetical protein
MPDMAGGQGDAAPGWAELCTCEGVFGLRRFREVIGHARGCLGFEGFGR